MRHVIAFTVCIMLLFALLVAGCTSTDDHRPADELRADLIAYQVAIEQSNAATLTLWDRIIFGEVVSCQEVILVPEPLMIAAGDQRAYPNTVIIQEHLNSSLQYLRNASDLWNIECNEMRQYVPLSLAKEARANAVLAHELLNTAATLLTSWP